MILFIFLASFSVFCQERPFVVIFSDIVEPCVMFNEEHKPYGFDVDLFDKIAEKIKLTNYQYREVQFKNIFYDVKAGYADIGIGGITITSKRERTVDFTHPYLQADIKVLAKAEKENGLLAILNSIWQKNVLILILAVIIFALGCGIVLWIAERKSPENSKTNFLKLIFDFFYFTIVTVSTVGYGDRTAKTCVGKIMVVLIILSGLAIFGCYIGTVTTNIQFDRVESEIKSITELRDKPIATLEDTYASDVLFDENLGSKVYKVKDLPSAINLLKTDKVKAVVFDAPPLLRYASKNPGYMVAPFSVRIQNYGFVIPMNSPWRVRINQALLELQESGEYQKIYDKWF
jgi:ABC-type amino acid transport substrate-binding protein